jgi:hypothetical protein
MDVRLYRLVFPCLLALLLAVSARTETALMAALPEGVTPLPPESAGRFEELLAAAEKYRGLKARRPVPAGTLAEPELRKKLAQSLAEDLPPEELEAIELSAKAFGLIPESLDLARYLPELLTSQVAGFYDPVRRYMALVRRGEGEEDRLAEDVVIVHELTHALQDQHFELRSFESLDPMSDGATARSALTEGDATLTMTSFLAGAQVETLPGAGDAMKSLLENPESLAGAMADVPGGGELEKAPAWIRDSLLFSYVRGFTFCLEVKRAGGQKLLDHAFRSDPPRSSEQILHPEKWHGRRDDPLLLAWPDLAAALPGWSKASEGEAGEATIQTLLRPGTREREKADAAAAGWGGDRFAVYRKEGRRLLVWWTEWDSEEDAQEFRAALGGLGDGWSAESLSPRRILALRGELDELRRVAVRERLTAAETAPPP